MASEGSRMKKYNHLENQTLKVVTLLNSHKFASSMGDEGSQLRGVYEDLHTLSNGSRPREGWKSHVQKKVKGPESHAALVRERGLVGLPLFSEEVAAQRMAQSRRAAELDGRRCLFETTTDLLRGGQEHSQAPPARLFSPTLSRPSSRPLPATVSIFPASADHESEVCQSIYGLDQPFGASTRASDLPSTNRSASSDSQVEQPGERRIKRMTDSDMQRLCDDQDRRGDIANHFPKEDFDSEWLGSLNPIRDSPDFSDDFGSSTFNNLYFS